MPLSETNSFHSNYKSISFNYLVDMHIALLILSGLGTASALGSPFQMIEHHVSRARSLNGTASPATVAGARGSLVYLDNGNDCDEPITSGFGFTLGECVVRQNEAHGVKYSNCFYDTGKIVFTFTECSDVYCNEDCVDYMMIEQQCIYDPEPYNGKLSCDSNVDAYHNYEELTLHSR